MAKQCFRCHTINVDRLAQCAWCGARLPGDRKRLRWDNAAVLYIALVLAIAVLIAVIALVFFPATFRN